MGGGDDLFVWTANDDLDLVESDGVTPSDGVARDVIIDFNSGDKLELSDLLDGESYTLTGTEVTGGNILDYLSAADNGSGGVDISVSIDGGGAVTQVITLESTSINAQIIGSLIDSGAIIVDQI